jgi:hypothetical protein
MNMDALHSDHINLSTHILVQTKLSCCFFMQFGTGVLDKRFYRKHKFCKKQLSVVLHQKV